MFESLVDKSVVLCLLVVVLFSKAGGGKKMKFVWRERSRTEVAEGTGSLTLLASVQDTALSTSVKDWTVYHCWQRMDTHNMLMHDGNDPLQHFSAM